MSQSELEIVVKARDEASKAMSSMGAKIGKAFNNISIAALGVGTALAAFGAKAVGDFAEAEKASAMLEHAVVNVTGATKEQLKATSDLADALEKKGVLDGDNIKMGLAQLSTFGLSNKAVQALGGSLADLAVNQNGVKATGEQLSDTANTIAKALNGQFGVLEKSGIRFTAAQQAAIQFGTEMQKVDAINQGFAQNLKFTNEVALGTTEGQMAKAAVTAGNLSESIGGLLAPVVQKLAERLVPVIEKVTAWVEKNPELTTNIILGTAAVVAFLAILGPLTTAIMAVGAALAFVAANPVIIIIAAIIALIAGIVWMIKNWDLVKAKILEVWTWITDFIKQHWELILNILFFGMGSIIKIIVDNWDAITAAWSGVWNGVKNILTSIMDGAKAVIMGTINWVISKLNGAISLANSAISLANKVPGVNIGTINEIPQLAAGGIVNSPTLAMIGESGPEAVVPLSRGSSAMGGMGGTTVNINIGSFWGGDPERAAREIGDLIIRRLQINARVS